jgi:hypothetical protein
MVFTPVCSLKAEEGTWVPLYNFAALDPYGRSESCASWLQLARELDEFSASGTGAGVSIVFKENGRVPMSNSVSDWLNNLHPSLRPLWDLENELRRAAQNAIFLRNDDAKKHLDEARRHYKDALAAIRGERLEENKPVQQTAVEDPGAITKEERRPPFEPH